jgi:hypothetical protein
MLGCYRCLIVQFLILRQYCTTKFNKLLCNLRSKLLHLSNLFLHGFTHNGYLDLSKEAIGSFHVII